MKELLKIGQMCKIVGVTPDTLRLYERRGLLRPAVVGDNGYRYYRRDQLDVLEEILLLKQAGASLSQIHETFESGDVDVLGDRLLLQRDVLEAQIERLKRALAHIDRRLAYVSSASRAARLQSTGCVMREAGALGHDVELYLVDLAVLLDVGSDAADTDGSEELEVWDVFRVGSKADVAAAAALQEGAAPLVVEESAVGLSFAEAGGESPLAEEVRSLARAGGATEVCVPKGAALYEFWGAVEDLPAALEELAQRRSLKPGTPLYGLNGLALPLKSGTILRFLKLVVPQKVQD